MAERILEDLCKSNNNISLPYKFKPRREGDNPVTYCICDKANKLLEWHAKYDIKDICKDTYNFAKMKI